MTVAEVVKKMVEYSKGDLHDISHFMKVYAYAKTIAEGENLSPEQQKLVEVTAVVHDIACPLCRVKYGNATLPTALSCHKHPLRSELHLLSVPQKF